MMAGLAIVFCSFWGLAIASFFSRELRARVFKRTVKDWVVDFSGLIVQGLAVPLVQSLALAPLWSFIVPNLKGALDLPWWAAFILSFVAVDYAYYWNHRMLHLPLFWRWHRMHHSANEVDIFATARNSLLTPMFIVYVWINSILVFTLGDPTPFIVASSVGAALDLWRHSGFSIATTNPLHSLLGSWLILPQDHARHHAPFEVQNSVEANFGANLKWWDVLHGTFEHDAGPALATKNSETPQAEISVRELFWPAKESST